MESKYKFVPVGLDQDIVAVAAAAALDQDGSRVRTVVVVDGARAACTEPKSKFARPHFVAIPALEHDGVHIIEANSVEYTAGAEANMVSVEAKLFQGAFALVEDTVMAKSNVGRSLAKSDTVVVAVGTNSLAATTFDQASLQSAASDKAIEIDLETPKNTAVVETTTEATVVELRSVEAKAKVEATNELKADLCYCGSQ